MSTQEYISSLHQKFDILKSGQLIGVAAQDTHSKMVERVFEDGHNAQDSEIGGYNSSKPLYVNPKNSPRNFPTKGKSGDSKFEDGKLHKTGYFSSYKAYREAVGRQTGRVDLVMFGNLKSDFSKAVIRLDTLKFASSVSRVESSEKIKGIESKYGNVFRLTPKERTNFKQVLAFETFNLLR